jgi:hypothetical protein
VLRIDDAEQEAGRGMGCLAGRRRSVEAGKEDEVSSRDREGRYGIEAGKEDGLSRQRRRIRYCGGKEDKVFKKKEAVLNWKKDTILKVPVEIDGGSGIWSAGSKEQKRANKIVSR